MLREIPLPLFHEVGKFYPNSYEDFARKKTRCLISLEAKDSKLKILQKKFFILAALVLAVLLWDPAPLTGDCS